jgi:histidine ammonia-lyase
MTSFSSKTAPCEQLVRFGDEPITIETLVLICRGDAEVALSDAPAFRARIDSGRRALATHLAASERIYGVTTGVGDSCANSMTGEQIDELPLNLFRFHGCGTGAALSVEESRAVVVARLSSLVTGYSGVRLALLEALVGLLRAGIAPRFPSEGSVGASGDLTPLSYLAAVLSGERQVIFEGEVVSAASALSATGLTPLRLEAKESLALMNGTSAMTGLACLAFDRAARLARLSAALTAVAVDVMRGEARHFDDRLFVAKPHPGQRAVANWIREDLDYDARQFPEPTRIQDRYSLRCAPHVIGVLVDSLPFLRSLLEVELNSANDNPLVDPDTGALLHGGNFYGGHVCHAMDLLKTSVANLADLLDRQMQLLCNPATNNGLPENLVLPSAGVAHHGFKAMQILTSALAAEAAKLTMPASVFSRSTENHNQDKVSMGTIAARDCTRIIELTETIAAVHLLSVCQAVDLRGGQGCHRRSLDLLRQVRAHVPTNTADRAMDGDILQVLDLLRSRDLDFGSHAFA